MRFTVKTIFPQLDLPTEQIMQHKRKIGLNILNSWKARYGTLPPKIEEDKYLVFCYPDEFRQRAETLLKRYIAKYNLPAKPKRKRIFGTYEKVKKGVNQIV